jgi:hypothetical protein
VTFADASKKRPKAYKAKATQNKPSTEQQKSQLLLSDNKHSKTED